MPPKCQFDRLQNFGRRVPRWLAEARSHPALFAKDRQLFALWQHGGIIIYKLCCKTSKRWWRLIRFLLSHSLYIYTRIHTCIYVYDTYIYIHTHTNIWRAVIIWNTWIFFHLFFFVYSILVFRRVWLPLIVYVELGNKSQGREITPIPGCHAPEGHCAQCCGCLDLSRNTQIPPVSWPQEFSRFHPTSSLPTQLAKPSATKISEGQDPGSPEGSIPVWKRVRGVMGDKVCHQDLPPTNLLHVTHGCQTLPIHEGRSDYPMSPQQP